MPVPVLKKYAEQAGVSIEKAEECWEKAKKAADKVYKDKPKNDEYWGFVNIKTKQCLGIENKPKTKK